MQQSLLILNRMKVFIIVLNKISNPDFEFLRHCYFTSIVSKSKEFLFQYSALIIHASEDRREIANRERIKPDPENHPNDTQDEFCVCQHWYVSIAYCRDGLQRPVERGQVQIDVLSILDTSLSDPGIKLEVGELCWEEPETWHQVDHEENPCSDLSHS